MKLFSGRGWRWFCVLFAVVLGLVLLVPGASGKGKPKPRAQEWQIRGIEAALEDDRPGVKQLALEKLATYDPREVRLLLKPDTVQKIGNLLRDDKQQNPYVRSSAAVTLSNLGDAAKPFIPDILNFIKDPKQDSSVRGSAAMALSDLGDAAKPFILDIANLLKDPKQNFSVRTGAAVAVGNLGDAAKPFIPDILNFIRDPKQDSSVRGSAAEAFGNLGDTAKPFILDIANILKDPKQDSSVRTGAAVALSNLGDAAKPFIPDILDFIKDFNQYPYWRTGAAVELSNLGDAAKPFILNILNILKDPKQDSSVRERAAAELSNLGNAAKSFILDIANLLKDPKQDSSVRTGAAVALGNLGEVAKPFIPNILNFIKDPKQYLNARSIAAEALGNLGKLRLDEITPILNLAYEERADVDRFRFLAYLSSGGDDNIKRSLKWLAKPKQLPEKLEREEGAKTLEVFKQLWEPSKDLPELRSDLEAKIALVAKKVTWKNEDLPLLQQHYKNLKDSGSSSADSVQAAITALEAWQWVTNLWTTLLAHAGFWLALIFLYPKSPAIQAIFFWNPWIRTIFGFGYVTFLLTWVPFLRRKLFEPFKISLLADAALDRFNPDFYFPGSDVKPQGSDEAIPLAQAIPRLKGQVVLEGDSGLGKTMFLRHLLQQSDRIVVYLPAPKCAEGAIEAIQRKLHGDEIKDPKFLQSLIYSGAIDICIDGLNEVSPDTRAKISQFVESHFRGNILLTTQPLEWLPPATAKTYTLQPLQLDQIQQYLLSRRSFLPKASPVQGEEYDRACQTFLDSLLHPSTLSPEEQKAAQAILSNPMELDLAARMLAAAHPPDLFRLREQQYNLMAQEYQQTWNKEFPLKPFSEAVYQLRLTDKTALPATDFYNELVAMEDEKYRMVVSRQWQDSEGKAKKEWYFRHDKIAEFFMVQTFLGETEAASDRLYEHIGDPRFRGVYFLLATLLPLDAAQELREDLIQYAADTKDHTVSDTFVQLLRVR
jgi:HEAT repeat protein